MVGLLYKDFVAIRGKIYVICVAAALLLGFVVRLLIQNDAAEYLLVMYMIVFVFGLYILVNNKIETDLMRVDEAKKQKQYCISLPVTKKKYVAGKYVFMLLVLYFIQSFCILFCNIMVVDCLSTVCLQITSIIMGLLPMITSVLLVTSAVEMPFFIGLGYTKGNLLKQGLLETLFVLFIVYMLFGDLNIIEKFSVDRIVTWIEGHQSVMNALQIFTPVIALIVYYLSYRISCFLYERRELTDD